MPSSRRCAQRLLRLPAFPQSCRAEAIKRTSTRSRSTVIARRRSQAGVISRILERCFAFRAIAPQNLVRACATTDKCGGYLPPRSANEKKEKGGPPQAARKHRYTVP